MIGILKIENSGNLFSLQQALKYLNFRHIIIKNNSDLTKCNKVIIPGVGSYSNCMEYLNSKFEIDHLKSSLKNKKVLGICVGMQILTEYGLENKLTNGLGLIEGYVTKIKTNQALPHVGFNSLLLENSSQIFSNIMKSDLEFYFTHSFEVITSKHITSKCKYHNKEIIASIQKGNIFGIQFHPENSKKQGLELLKNFLSNE